MEIKPIIISGALGSVAPPVYSGGKPVEGQRDSTAFGQMSGLDAWLRQEPAARTATVERAREQIGDHGWPPALAMRQISQLLAVNLSQKN
jgi:hypothetical protein